MNAVQLVKYGGSEAIAINELSDLTPSDGTIVIKVNAAGVNPFDYKLQQGYLKDIIPLQLPITLGGDFAGVVTAVGEGVSNLKIGDEVFGQAIAVAGNSGSFAEHASTKTTHVALKPQNLDFTQAAALPLAGSSAIQALFDHMNLQSGQKILIHGGAGGIGTMAIQIAKHIGAHVATTVSPGDMEYVRGLGADEVINYREQKFDELLSEYDAVFDTVGGETTNRSLAVLKHGGTIVSMVQPADATQAAAKNINVIAQNTKVTTERLQKLKELVEQNVITVNVEKTFPLADAAEALDYIKNTPPKGKVVITVV